MKNPFKRNKPQEPEAAPVNATEERFYTFYIPKELFKEGMTVQVYENGYSLPESLYHLCVNLETKLKISFDPYVDRMGSRHWQIQFTPRYRIPNRSFSQECEDYIREVGLKTPEDWNGSLRLEDDGSVTYDMTTCPEVPFIRGIITSIQLQVEEHLRDYSRMKAFVLTGKKAKK